jgi:hypothetical protein
MPPADVQAVIQAEVVGIKARNLRAAWESKRVLESFERAGIPVLFVKGLSLSAFAYGDPFLKMSSDIDLLIDSADLQLTGEILIELGYKPVRHVSPTVSLIGTVGAKSRPGALKRLTS